MVDPTDLALHARSVLADARQVTLLVQGIGRIRPDDPEITLRDDHGRPTFVCASGSAVTRAARDRRAALLSVPECDASGEITTLLLSGPLEVVGRQRAFDLVTLLPASITLEQDSPHCTTIRQFHVPLDLYALATPCPITACARRIAEHTNDAHQDELRRFAAAGSGSTIDAVAGARLAGLDAGGGEVQWVDSTGAHSTRITFAPPARTPSELAGRLREQLERSPRE